MIRTEIEISLVFLYFIFNAPQPLFSAHNSALTLEYAWSAFFPDQPQVSHCRIVLLDLPVFAWVFFNTFACVLSVLRFPPISAAPWFFCLEAKFWSQIVPVYHSTRLFNVNLRLNSFFDFACENVRQWISNPVWVKLKSNWQLEMAEPQHGFLWQPERLSNLLFGCNQNCNFSSIDCPLRSKLWNLTWWNDWKLIHFTFRSNSICTNVRKIV